MPKYLAYQFDSSQLTKQRLFSIMDTYFDFSDQGPRNTEEWFEWTEKEIERRKGFRNPEVRLRMESISNNLLHRASYFGINFHVKNNPLLEIYFRYNEPMGIYFPLNSSGLNIWAEHSGSEGLVKLIEFKPEMDAYLEIIGINYVDRSNV